MARRSEHSKEQIRDMALAAAEAIVDAEGTAALTTRKVAGRIGYTVGTLYLVFENLDDLIIHVNGRTLDELLAVMRTTTAGRVQPRDGIRALGRAYLAFASAKHARWSLLYEHRWPEERALPDWFEPKVQRIFALLEERLRPLNPRRDEAAAHLAARALWSGVHGICVLSLSDKLSSAGQVPVAGLLDSLLDNYLAGYMGAGEDNPNSERGDRQ